MLGKPTSTPRARKEINPLNFNSVTEVEDDMGGINAPNINFTRQLRNKTSFNPVNGLKQGETEVI
jgi:hypothetical protein